MFCETHCNSSDSVSLDGYSAVSTTRPKSKKANKYTRGIAVLVKKICEGIKFFEWSNSEYCWFKIDKSFFNFDEDIYVATVYVSHSCTSFSARNEDIFGLIEANITVYIRVGQCILVGDFNAQTNIDLDCCVDDNIDDHVDIPFHYIQDNLLPRGNHDFSHFQ